MDEMIMNEEMNMENEVVTYEGDTENSGVGTAVAMAIGAGLTLATAAAIKVGKKLYQKWKDHKELRKPEEGKTIEVDEAKIVDVVAEDVTDE